MNKNRDLAAARNQAADHLQGAHQSAARTSEPAEFTNRLGRRERRLAGVSLLAVLLAVAGLLFGVWSGQKANQAERQARLALARQLAAQSLNQLDLNNDLAWLLAIEAGRRAETVETFSAVRRAFAHPGHTLTILSGHKDKVNQAVWNADESRVLTSSDDGTARVWDAATGAQLIVLTGHRDWVNTAIWNAAGSRILTASDDGTARVWYAESGDELLSLTGHTDWIQQAIWSRDESRILTASGDGTAR